MVTSDETDAQDRPDGSTVGSPHVGVSLDEAAAGVPYGDVRAGSRAKGQNPSRTDGNRGRLTACASAPTKIVTYGPWNLSWSRPGYGSHEPINLREATIAVSQAELSQLDGAIEDPGPVPNVTAARPSTRQAVDPDTLRLTLEALREFTTNHFVVPPV